MTVSKVILPANSAELTVYLQDKSNELNNAAIRPAALIFPGGGYQMCSDREAEPVALAYLAEGYNAFVLRYSVGDSATFEQAFTDAKEALRHIRSNAGEYAVDPAKIAVIGFSAGGHLASSLGTMSEEKPNALVLGYAVINQKFGPPLNKQTPATDEYVTEATPPTFIFTTSDDSLVTVENSIVFAHALAKNDVYFEMHVYMTGEHGLSLAKENTSSGRAGMVNITVSEWFAASVRFLRDVFGGFEMNGARVPSVLEQLNRVGLDMPLKKLLKNKASADILRKHIPTVIGMTENNPAAASVSLRLIAMFSPDNFPSGVLEKIEAELEALNH
ncbi:MAG: alpha/beta hydrolase [Oscillospiraceae bacterium]|nr:alpha/beta hydrolase [Oscillospiraceae bacterium]